MLNLAKLDIPGNWWDKRAASRYDPGMAQTDSIPVQADLFPAKVTFPDGRVLDPVKAIVGHDRVWFYQLTGNEGTLVSEHPLDDISGTAQHGYTAVADGREIRIDRSRECGCGTNKSWKPFPYRVAMTPMRRS